MQKHGYELMQAETNLWFVAKKDEPSVVAVSNAELKTLLAATDAQSFARILEECRLQPPPGRPRKRISKG